MPRRIPKKYMAIKVARMRAVNGCPQKAIISVKSDLCRTPLSTRSPEKVLSKIKNSGIPIVTAMRVKEGSPFSCSIISSGSTSSSGGAFTSIFFEMYLPNMGPAMIAVGIPNKKPNRITQPNCTSIISATATGPGVGGIKLCVTANPARRGMP